MLEFHAHSARKTYFQSVIDSYISLLKVLSHLRGNNLRGVYDVL